MTLRLIFRIWSQIWVVFINRWSFEKEVKTIQLGTNHIGFPENKSAQIKEVQLREVDLFK